MKRVLGLYFPYLTADRLTAGSESVGGSAPEAGATAAASAAPLVVTATQASMVRVVSTDARAAYAGIRPGMTLAEARALVPSLAARPHHPRADRAALESMAVWADRFSPCAHLEGDDTLLLDVSGCHRLFPDEEALLRRVIDGVRTLGYTVRGALADTPGAAWALAHTHPADRIVAPPGQTVAALAPLPVAALRLEPRVVAALRSLGVETIEALLHLPRSSLGSRFGDDLLYRLDQALGDEPELLTPFRPVPVLESSLRIGRATDRYDVLREAVERTLAGFCEQLERRVSGVRQLFVTFYCPELRPITFELKVSRPTRSVRHLRSMLTATLDNLQLPTGATGVTLWARRVEPLDAWQDELFDTGRADQEGLADLIDRLSSHLGPTAVVRPHPLSDHQPERTFEYVPLVDYGLANAEAESEKLEVRSEKRVLPEGIVTGTVLTSNFSLRSSPFSLLTSHFPSRPLRLLPKPVEVPVIAVVPEGPPSCFDWKGAREEITDCVGPERLETGWWRGQHVRRDYFRVTCRSGRGCWLFRQCETSRWFLHGWFD